MLETFDHGEVRELRLARPPVNALDPQLVTALTAELADAAAVGARAVVLAGRPGIFSAGLDVPWLLAHQDRATIRAAWRDLYGLMQALAASPVPVAAAITGHSPAGGAVLTLFCDYRVMAAGDYRIGLNEVEVGIPMPPVIYQALKRLIGTRQAERLCVGGLMLTAAEAAAIGLIDELAPMEEVGERALAWCRSLLALPSRAMLETRATVREDLVALFQGRDEAELDHLAERWFSAETQATLKALVERLKKR